MGTLRTPIANLAGDRLEIEVPESCSDQGLKQHLEQLTDTPARWHSILFTGYGTVLPDSQRFKDSQPGEERDITLMRLVDVEAVLKDLRAGEFTYQGCLGIRWILHPHFGA